MPKIPYKAEKSRNDEEDYEIVSFEEFCDKPTNSKNDLLTLNDNINYRLCYETDHCESVKDESKECQELKETSLSSNKTTTWKKRSSGFAPFGKHQRHKDSLLSGVIPKGKVDDDPAANDHRYQRFSNHRNFYDKCCVWPGLGTTILILSVLLGFVIVTWWVVGLIVGNPWGDEHYRKLWERVHPDEPQRHTPTAPVAPYPHEKILPEIRYHDHNNLSTKNKLNATENSKKKTAKKNSEYTERPIKDLNKLCANIKQEMRFDCFPQSDANEEACVQRGCCWNSDVLDDHDSIPYCFYPPQYDTFNFSTMTENKHGVSVYYEKMRPSGYPDDFEIAQIDFKYISNDVLQIKIQDAENIRKEPVSSEIPIVPGPINDLKYRVLVGSSKGGFKVERVSDNVTILDTQNVGGLILSDKFLQMSSLLPANKIYGLGERRSRFQLSMDWKIYTMFNFDTVPNENTNLYGTHPFYLALEDNGQSHGMLLLNSHPIDVVLQPTPAITYRTVGGILDFFVFFGPSPSEVVSQYTGLIGMPFMPPYWSLGFHLCKFNYGSLKVTKEVWQRTRLAGIPFDVQWNDIDYMNNSNMFTYDHVEYAGLPNFVKELHDAGMHYIPLIDPGVSASEPLGQYPPFDRGLELNVFIKNSSDKPFVGKVWNKLSTVWPDFTHPNSTDYWVEMLQLLHKQVPFDGAWTDMNEPSNFISGSMYGSCAPENLPYKPHAVGGDGLKTKTLCMDAQHYAGPHFDYHNLFSLLEATATNFALKEIRGRRPFIISRSSFVGLGKYAGHWSGDINSDWHDMEMTIPELLSFSLFGVPMMGADICGFRGNATPQLCKRWMQLGAFYPFSRNHNSDSSSPQDPVSLGEEVVIASRNALRLRYSLLPYYYTMFWRAHVYGETVARPMFFEFPTDSNTHAIDDQFMIGPHLLITPILKQGANTSTPYLNDQQHWHNIRNGKIIQNPGAVLDENSTVLMRGGGIIIQQRPIKEALVTTTNTRQQPLQITVATPDHGQGHGELYWDNGDSLNSYEERTYSLITFVVNAEEKTLNSDIVWWGYGIPTVSEINLFNVKENVTQVTVHGKKCVKPKCTYTWNDDLVLTVAIDLDLEQPFTLKWAA